MEETTVAYSNVDYETACKFIASNSAEADIWRWGMERYIPRRRSNKGCRPGPNTAELGQKRKENLMRRG